MTFGLLAGPWATRTARFQRTPWRILGSFSTESCKARDLLRGRPADDKQSPSGRCGRGRCAAVKNPVTIAQPGGLDNSKAALAQRMHAGDEPAGMAGGRRKDRPFAHCTRPVRAAGVQRCSLRTNVLTFSDIESDIRFPPNRGRIGAESSARASARRYRARSLRCAARGGSVRDSPSGRYWLMGSRACGRFGEFGIPLGHCRPVPPRIRAKESPRRLAEGWFIGRTAGCSTTDTASALPTRTSSAERPTT
jgi:hypothetical protein